MGTHKERLRRGGTLGLRLVGLLLAGLCTLAQVGCTAGSTPASTPTVAAEAPATPPTPRPPPQRAAAESIWTISAGRSDAVEAVVARQMRQLDACYERLLARAPERVGTIELGLWVGADGRVERAISRASTLLDPDFEGCLERRGSRWRFPLPEEAHEVVLSLEFRRVLEGGTR